MKHRREALQLLLAMALAPRAFAQQASRVRVVGYLLEGSGYPRNLAGRLRDLGYEDGRNLRFEIRRIPKAATAEQLDRAATELASSASEVIVAVGADNVRALHRATHTIPIVTGGVGNPVSLGFARSLREPGMNVTGLSFGLEESALLQFGTLKRLRPRVKRVTFFMPATSPYQDLAPEHVSAAAALGLDLDVALLSDMNGFAKALGAMRDASAEAVWVDEFSSPISMKQVASLAIRRRVASYARNAEWIRDGFLLSCGLFHSDPNLRIASIVDKILRGIDPRAIPFEQPDRTELVLNRATAAAIGVEIPEDLRLRATQIVG